MSLDCLVYVRDGCHLCEDMIAHLLHLKENEGLDFSFTEVEISGDAELEQKYGTKVPVLECQGQEICHYTLDVKRLANILPQ